MGALATLSYASKNAVRALALLNPVVPKGYASADIPLPVDMSEMWFAPPERLRQLFWDKVDDEKSERFLSLACPESPQAVIEATRWRLEVDVNNITVPAYLMGAERDMLAPHQYVEFLAKEMEWEYDFVPDEGHGLPLNPIWEDVALRIAEWLDKTVK
jgi:pimeloyl-ACP methyl ester carboxylesterase